MCSERKPIRRHGCGMRLLSAVTLVLAAIFCSNPAKALTPCEKIEQAYKEADAVAWAEMMKRVRAAERETEQRKTDAIDVYRQDMETIEQQYLDDIAIVREPGVYPPADQAEQIAALTEIRNQAYQATLDDRDARIFKANDLESRAKEYAKNNYSQKLREASERREREGELLKCKHGKLTISFSGVTLFATNSGLKLIYSGSVCGDPQYGVLFGMFEVTRSIGGRSDGMNHRGSCVPADSEMAREKERQLSAVPSLWYCIYKLGSPSTVTIRMPSGIYAPNNRVDPLSHTVDAIEERIEGECPPLGSSPTSPKSPPSPKLPSIPVS